MSSTAPEDSAARRSRLLGIKLRALVSEHLDGVPVGEAAEFLPGAALVHGDAAWVVLDDGPNSQAARRLGAALIWAARSGAGELHLIVDDPSVAGVLARRTEAFTLPVVVWCAVGRRLASTSAAPLPVSLPASSEHEQLRELIVAGGADPVVEHGVLFGEVRGLEVCRVVDDPHLDVVRLEVGVGAHDRELFQMLHGDVPTVESLGRIVAAVEKQRFAGAPPHPLNRLGAERLLRWRLEQAPELVGATRIVPASPPVPRPNLKDPIPCVASGTGADGRAVEVVCSVGVDLELIPYATDARLAAQAASPGVAGGERLVVALPSRDRLGVVEELAGLLRQPIEFVSID